MSTAGVPNIADDWKELSGQNDWAGLLDPIDVRLRFALINYGERAASAELALYYKYIDDCRGFSRFSEQHFFNRLGVDKNRVIPYKYDVKKFIYARVGFSFFGNTELFGESTWIGYVAVANDEATTVLGRRDIVIAWRGTVLLSEWIKDVYAVQTDAPLIFDDSEAKVHSGFYSIYTDSKKDSKYSSQSARDQVLTVLKDLLEQYKDEDVSITVVGHSLGAALATLNAADIVAHNYNGAAGKSIMVTAFAFGSPRVGNDKFKTAFEALKAKGLHLLRISNVLDIVPTLPRDIDISLPIGDFSLQYSHVGIELEVDTRLSDYLKPGTDVHNIDVYLHGCDGSQGVAKEFDRKVLLDPALLNRRADALVTEKKYELKIPDNWWYPAENKDMIQYENGDFNLKPGLYLPILDL